MKTRSLLCVFVFALSALAPLSALTLEEALNDVLQTNPRIREKVKEYNASVQDIHRTSAANHPSLDLEAEAGREDISNSSTRFRSQGAWVKGARVVARQKVFDGKRTDREVKARELIARSTMNGYFEAANQTVFDTLESYLAVLKYLELTTLAQENVDIHQRLLESIRMRVESGKEGKSELERVQGRLAAAQSVLISRQNDYKRSIYAFHKNLGRIVEGGEMVRPAFDQNLLPATLDQALDHLNANHPTLAAANLNIEEKTWEYKREQSDDLPTVFFEASRDWRNDFSGVPGSENDTRAMMKMQFNLLDGGGRSARKSRAVSMVQREQETRDRVKRALINDLQLTWTAYKLLDSQIGAMRKSLYFTRRALESYKQEFKIGKRLLINILDAENEYQNARAQLAAIEFDLLSQKFRLLFSMGTIVEDLHLQAPFARELKAMKRPRTLTRDRLPLVADRDRDGIDDQRDLSMNSLPGLPVDRLGETASASRGYFQDAVATGTMGGDTAQVRSKEELQVKRLQPNVSTRVDFVSFDKGSVEMSPESKVLMRELIAQVKPIAGDGLIQIMVTTNEFPGDADNYRLALQRAYNLKKILTLHDLDPEGIQVFAEQRAVSQTENSVSFRLATDLSGFREGFSTVSEPGLNFPAGEQTLTEAARNALSRLADQIRQQGNPPIDIVVYGNDFKDAARDEKLSAQRGEEIRKVLGEAGLPLEHAVVIPWGNFAPGDDLYRKAGDEESRNRVEIVIRR